MTAQGPRHITPTNPLHHRGLLAGTYAAPTAAGMPSAEAQTLGVRPGGITEGGTAGMGTAGVGTAGYGTEAGKQQRKLCSAKWQREQRSVLPRDGSSTWRLGLLAQWRPARHAGCRACSCLPLAQQRLPSGVTNEVLPGPLRTASPHAMQRPLPQQSQQLTQSSAHDYITHLPLLLLLLFHMAQAMAPLPAHAPPWRRRRSAVG